jgi:cell division protein FtsX
MTSEGSGLSKEELEQIQKDALAAKMAKEDEINKAKTQVRSEVEKEFQLKKELEEAQKARDELNKKLEEEKKASEQKHADLQKQMDELKSSKAPVQPQNPFKEAKELGMKRFTPEQMNEIEEQSRQLFMQERGRLGK